MQVILSQDILGICLVFSGGNLEMALEDIAELAEKFQEDEARHFGITRNDFRMLLMRLIWEKVPGSIFSGESILEDAKLKDVTIDMLKYQDIAFNDEGEYWTPANSPGIQKEPDTYYQQYLDSLNLNSPSYELKKQMKQLMVEFFDSTRNEKCSVKQFQDLMTKTGLNNDILYACSISGSGG